MAVKSPPNSRQKDMFAKEASSHTIHLLAGRVQVISLYVRRASSKSVLLSAMAQLSLLNCVLMLKLMPVWRSLTMLL